MPHPAVWRDTLLAVAAVSALPLLAMALLARDERRVRRLGQPLVCVAVGALLGAALFQLIPEAYATATVPRAIPETVLLGVGTFVVLEWLLHGRHGHHDPARASHAHGHADEHAAGRVPIPRAMVWLNLAGDATHNLLDGVLIAATFLADPAIGVLATVAVSLHEIPRELGSFGVYVHGGLPARTAVRYNLATAGLSAAGAGATLLVGAHAAGVAQALLPFAAGNFLYIAASLLRPLLRHPGSTRQVMRRVALVALGLAATAVPALVR